MDYEEKKAREEVKEEEEFVNNIILDEKSRKELLQIQDLADLTIQASPGKEKDEEDKEEEKEEVENYNQGFIGDLRGDKPVSHHLNPSLGYFTKKGS